MARLPWKPGEREKAEKLLKDTGSVFVRKSADGLMELPEEQPVEGGHHPSRRNPSLSRLSSEEQARASAALREGEFVVARYDRLSADTRQQPAEIKEEEQGRRSYLEILARAKENETGKTATPEKESPGQSSMLIATKSTPNEEITQIVRQRTTIKKLPGYTEEVRSDGSIVSSKQSKEKGAKPVTQVRLKDDRDSR